MNPNHTSLISTLTPLKEELQNEAAHHQSGIHEVENKKRGKKQQIDALLLAYMYIFQSVQIDHESAVIQAKRIENNALEQSQLIREEGAFQFETLKHSQLYQTFYFGSAAEAVMFEKMIPHTGWVIHKTPGGRIMAYIPKTISSAVLGNMSSTNLYISAERSIMEDKLSVLRQGAQVGETNLNSVTDEDQQSVQQGAGLMQMLVNLTNQITRI